MGKPVHSQDTLGDMLTIASTAVSLERNGLLEARSDLDEKFVKDVQLVESIYFLGESAGNLVTYLESTKSEQFDIDAVRVATIKSFADILILAELAGIDVASLHKGVRDLYTKKMTVTKRKIKKFTKA